MPEFSHEQWMQRQLDKAKMQTETEAFARDVMIPKLMKKYDQGPPFGGVESWGRPGSEADYARLEQMLMEHVERMYGMALASTNRIGDGKGDRNQLVDICNLAMMMHRVAFGDPQ